MKTLYNVFPKSGTHIIQIHRGLLHKHIRLFDDDGEFLEPRRITNMIKGYRGDCTGHIPYDKHIEDWLHDHNYRHVFIHRDLRDTALSLAAYVKSAQHKQSEFNILLDDGKLLSEQDDVLLACIYLVGNWYKRFIPWIEKADAVYTYEELRGAALLLGRESESATFRTGQSGAWRYKFKPHHKAAANEVLG